MSQEAYVLVVDDDPHVLSLVSTRLDIAGYRVTTAGDAWQSVIQAKGLKVGLIITDIQMPGFGTGVDAYKQLRQMSPLMPVIFMTGMPPEEARALIPPRPPRAPALEAHRLRPHAPGDQGADRRRPGIVG